MFHHALSRLVIANWKMNGNIVFAEEFFNQLIEQYNVENLENVKIVVCPPVHLISKCNDILQKTNSYNNILLGAQDCSEFSQNGAYTGEISATMLKEIGCRYAIIGHSEIRKLYNISNDNMKEKIISVQKASMIPVLCVGEKKEERNYVGQENIIYKQIIDSLSYEILQKPLVIAYEPIWAIGTGLNASAEQINHAYQYIKSAICKIYKDDIELDNLPLKMIYGGSVNYENTQEILKCDGFDGLLVGGNSLVIANFWSILKASNNFIGTI